MRALPLLVVLTLFTAGCARVPEPIPYDYSTQYKMQAAHHWDILAKDLANRINNELIRNDYLDTPVYVKTTCGDDATPCAQGETPAFNENFRDLLITNLVGYGIPTGAVETEDAIVINYKVQTLYHSTDRLRSIKPGVITALTAQVLVLRNFPFDLAALAAAGSLDYANSAVATKGKYEVIITTSMVTKQQYLFRSSDLYYINDRDFWHYQKSTGGTTVNFSTPAVKEVQKSGPQNTPTPPQNNPAATSAGITTDI